MVFYDDVSLMKISSFWDEDENYSYLCVCKVKQLECPKEFRIVELVDSHLDSWLGLQYYERFSS